MRKRVVALTLLILACPCLAKRTVIKIYWEDLLEQGKLKGGEVLSVDEVPFAQLKLVNPAAEQVTIAIMEIESPKIAQPSYAITGDVLPIDVEGKGYLEMRSEFSDGSSDSFRTLGDSEFTKPLEGKGEWRKFVLPCYRKDKSVFPEKIALNLVLPGRGTVYLSHLELVEYSPGENPLAPPTQWFSRRRARIAAVVFGVVAAVLAALGGVLGALGMGRTLALGILRVLMILGLLCIVAGVVAMTQSQPLSVYYPFLLVGLLSVIIPGAVYRTIRNRYEQLGT